MRAIALTALLVAGLSLWVGAQDDARQVRVARLIRLLGSRSYQERTLATQELERLGPVARESLEKEADSTNPEIRNRARSLLTKIKTAEIWEPSRVSLQCQEESAQKLLAKLALQTDNRLMAGDHYASFKDGLLTLDCRNQPYWAVLDDICRRTGNRVRPHYDQRNPGFVAVAGSLGKFPLAYAGPVRAKITGARRMFTQELNHQTGESEITHSFRLNLQLTWEDRLRLVAFRSQAELADAITDTNVEVAATGSDCGEWNAATRTTRQVSMSLGLQPPPTTARQFDVLRLKWELIAVGDTAVLEVSDLESTKVHEQDDVRLTVQSMEKSGNSRYKVALLVSRDLVIPEPRSVVVHENDVDLLDTQGRPLRKMVGGWRMTENGVRIQVTFTQDSTNTEPQRLRFTYPRIRSHRDLEIVFRDVPLPHERPE